MITVRLFKMRILMFYRAEVWCWTLPPHGTLWRRQRKRNDDPLAESGQFDSDLEKALKSLMPVRNPRLLTL